MLRITVLGAGRSVTGSKYLLEWKNFTMLIDCGLFQGPKENRARNWNPLPYPAEDIDLVVLTHAHIDHTGYLPRIVRDGFTGPIWATPPTRALLSVLLPDAGRLQEEEARFANKKGYAKHKPALPLYTEKNSRAAMKLLQKRAIGAWHEVHDGIRLRYHRAGHILGACSIELETKVRGGGKKTIVFSGDIGRFGVPILKDPEPYLGSDVLFLESTYGDRRHPTEDPSVILANKLKEGLDRGGMVVIPAFSIGRTQSMLYLLNGLFADGELPKVPVYLDSPMAIDATRMYSRFVAEHDAEMSHFFKTDDDPIHFDGLRITRSTAESKRINADTGPGIVISASGMVTGGRVLHHLAHRLDKPQNSIIFVGYQAEGTRGRQLVDGADEVPIFGRGVKVRAHVEQVSGFSAHADVDELLAWMARRERDPEQVLLVHGEYPVQQIFAETLKEKEGFKVTIPDIGDGIEL